MSHAIPPTDTIDWTPKRKLTLAQARRRSGLVKILRMMFTAGAAVSIGVLVGHLAANAISGSAGGVRDYKGSEIVTMLNPRFTGRDADGNAFVITADSAQRHRTSETRVDLVNPKLIDELGSEVTAPTGLYDQDEQTLDLYTDVRFVDPGGYAFSTSSARLYVLEDRIEGLEPLSGTGPLGDIRSDTYEIREEGEVMSFRGNVEMTFYPSEDTEDDEDAGEVERDDENG